MDSNLTYKKYSQDNYPVILIPENIEKSINKEISAEEAYQYYNIKKPKLELISLPEEPKLYYYDMGTKVVFQQDGCAGLPIFLLFVIAAIITLSVGAILPALFLCFGAIVMYSNTFTTKQKSCKKNVPQPIYDERLKEYNLNRMKVIKKNEELKNEHKKKIEEFETFLTKSKHDVAKKQLYLKSLKPINSFSRNLENRKRGKTEFMFLNKLFEIFDGQIKIDVAPDNYKYFPDFAFVCQRTGLHIDIEIDEPYTLREKEPIHYLDSDDNYRDEFFLSQNWCIIRFAEEQIVTQPEDCVELILNFVTSIQNKSLISSHNVKNIPKWTYEEACVMAYNNRRDKY